MVPTIAGFIENDINFSFFFAVVERLNGVPIDATIFDELFPDAKPPKEDKPPKEEKPPKEDPPPPAVVVPPAAPVQPQPVNDPIFFGQAENPVFVNGGLGTVPPAAPVQPQPVNDPIFFGQTGNPVFVNGGPGTVILGQPPVPGPTTVNNPTGCSNGRNFVTVTGGSSSFAPGGGLATTSNSGSPGADCGPVPVPVPAPTPAGPTPSPVNACGCSGSFCAGCGEGGGRRLRFRRVNLLQILDEPGDFTFFAPTNNAFTLIPQELLELLFLRDEFIPHLEDLLLYHALNGKRFAADFAADEIITAFNTEGLLVTQGNPLRINAIPAVRTNINASNGVTHVINGVLAPDWVANSILGFVTSMDDLSILFELLEIAKLDDKLDKFGDELTFVAPTNEAFTALGDAVLDSLRDPDNQKALVDILEYHIIKGVLTSPELSDGDSLNTRQRGSVEVSVNEDIMFNQATVVSSDSILANNGVLYKIDAVLNPDSVDGF
jgi:uncharacterized surface protein with fasciclin (FAS1) repeats